MLIKHANCVAAVVGVWIVTVIPCLAQELKQRDKRRDNEPVLQLTLQGGGQPLMWASLEPVQQELGLDDASRVKLKNILETFLDQGREIQLDRVKVQKLATDLQQKAKLEIERRTLTLDEETFESLYSLLSDDQLRRLQETFLQHLGTEALLRRDVRAWLSITESQFAELGKLEKAYRIGMDEERKRERVEHEMGIGDPKLNGRRQRVLREERDRKGVEILTTQQREMLKKAKGTPFEYDPTPRPVQ